ncbi:hypothetical protein S40285_02577 [Stachybotrys chlorohalonatus IBT 40285]|uniref:Uncharacterized protein n=1 Tax=Stachybotrys chlorohalonatus (strain IBT 40285) TaxID=1283841 RepID=A0A084QVS9_STAC4|nr:hypothetical protein S40285_02577 [Stachybotrys chlorohalonata IBT 40285]
MDSDTKGFKKIFGESLNDIHKNIEDISSPAEKLRNQLAELKSRVKIEKQKIFPRHSQSQLFERHPNESPEKISVLMADRVVDWYKKYEREKKAIQDHYHATLPVQEEAYKQRMSELLVQCIDAMLSTTGLPFPNAFLRRVGYDAPKPSHAASDEPPEDDRPTESNATRPDAATGTSPKAADPRVAELQTPLENAATTLEAPLAAGSAPALRGTRPRADVITDACENRVVSEIPAEDAAKRKIMGSNRSSEPKRQRTTAFRPTRTIDFKDVYQEGRAPRKYTIIQYADPPEKEPVEWYILDCRAHKKTFDTPFPLRGARIHARKPSHGGPKNSLQSKNAIMREFGILVRNCDATLAKMNNEATARAKKGVSQVIRPNVYYVEQVAALTSSEDPTIAVMEGGIYRTFYAPTKKWYAVFVLPLGDFGKIGLPGSIWDTDLLALNHNHCYKYSQATKKIWTADGFEHDGEKAHLRCVPVKYFDGVDLTQCNYAWVMVGDLHPILEIKDLPYQCSIRQYVDIRMEMKNSEAKRPPVTQGKDGFDHTARPALRDVAANEDLSLETTSHDGVEHPTMPQEINTPTETAAAAEMRRGKQPDEYIDIVNLDEEPWEDSGDERMSTYVPGDESDGGESADDLYAAPTASHSRHRTGDRPPFAHTAQPAPGQTTSQIEDVAASKPPPEALRTSPRPTDIANEPNHGPPIVENTNIANHNPAVAEEANDTTYRSYEHVYHHHPLASYSEMNNSLSPYAVEPHRAPPATMSMVQYIAEQATVTLREQHPGAVAALSPLSSKNTNIPVPLIFDSPVLGAAGGREEAAGGCGKFGLQSGVGGAGTGT